MKRMGFTFSACLIAAVAFAVPASAQDAYQGMSPVPANSAVVRSVMKEMPTLKAVKDPRCYEIRYVGSKNYVYVSYNGDYVMDHIQSCNPSDGWGYAIVKAPSGSSTDRWKVVYTTGSVPYSCSSMKKAFSSAPEVYRTLKKNQFCVPG